MNLPNSITFGRLLVAAVSFVLMLLDFWPLASILIVVAVIMDVLDGRVARRIKQVTTQGIYLDVLVDKIVIISAYLIIGVKVNVVWFYLGLLMLLREYSMDSMRTIAASKRKVVSADRYSKIKGVLFMVAMLSVIINHAFLGDIVLVEQVMTWVAILAMVLAYTTLFRFFIKYRMILLD